MLINTEKAYRMSIEHNKTLARRIPEEFFNEGNHFFLYES